MTSTAGYREKLARWTSAMAPALRTPQRALSEAGRAPSESASTPSGLGRALDFLSDLGVLAFAVWTLIAYVGMVTQARVSVLVPVWLATVPILAAILVALSRRNDGRVARERHGPVRVPRLLLQHRRFVVGAALGAGLSAAILAAVGPSVLWPVAWLGAVVVIALAVGFGRLRSELPERARRAIRWPAAAFAVLVGLGFAAMSLFLNDPSLDDAFYVNRAVGTAQLNRIPVRDIIFTDEQVPAISGTGLPVDTFSALEGASGHFIGIHGASVAYYIVPPLMTFFATWALWRLLRSWAPRSLLLCFALGCTYWLFSAHSNLTPGSYFLTRMWQGKVIFVAWLIPTTYVLLTRWLSRQDALTAVLLLAAGVSSIGLTASASFVAPLLFGTAAVPLFARRDWRGLPILAVSAAIPFVVGFVAAQNYSITLLTVRDLSTTWYFHQVFGLNVVAGLSMIGLLAAPWLTRSGPAARLASGITLVAILLLAPGVLPTLNDVTDLTTLLRRTLWIIPLPAMVGLLGAVSIAQLGRLAEVRGVHRRLIAAAPALLVAAPLVAFGHPLWTSSTGDSLWTSRPTWKTDEKVLTNAGAILDRYQGSEPILASPQVMGAIALLTVRPKAVNARGLYARLLPEPASRIRHRLLLTRFVIGEEPGVPPQQIRRALSDLRVGLVCVRRSKRDVISELMAIGNYRAAFRVRGRTCFRP
jgi:hypothetical protein